MEHLARPFLDDRHAAATLAATVPAFRDGPWQILSCRVAQTRRRVSRRLLREGGLWLAAVWRLEVRDTTSGERGEQWLYGRFYQGRDGTAHWAQEATAACSIPRFGRPVECLPEAGLVLWALPNDPSIDTLGAFLDPLALAAHLPPALSPDAGTRVAAEIVRHEPEEHCTARFQAIHEGSPVVFYGKCFADERWRDARDGLDVLWRQAQIDPRAFAVGRPLGVSPALGALWQAEVAGSPLADALRGEHRALLLERLVDALLRFQQGGPRQGHCESPAESVALARKWRKKLVLADAALADAADPVLSLLSMTPPACGASAPVHGDFHIDQMLWTGERIALFDYDNFAIGSPVRDLADCISQLLCRDDDGDWPSIASDLLAIYRARADTLDADDFAWHLRLMLMRKAYSFMVRAREGWRGQCERVLGLALAGCNALPPQPQRVAA